MSKEDAGGRDPLEQIFRLAGRRTPVDPERAAAIEERTHDAWQQMLARRRAEARRRRFTWAGGGLALAASILAAAILIPQMTTEAPRVATVVKQFGAPETGARGRAMVPLVVGAELHAGSVLETGRGDGAALQLASGHDLRLAESSRIRVEADSIVLDAGMVYLESGDGRQTRPIEVRSRLATVRELGTQYIVHLAGDALDVTVRDGAVRVAQGDLLEIARAGEQLQMDRFGQMQRQPVPERGEQWDWVAELASSPDLEQLTLAQFLRWLVREEGWQLEFADDELATAAKSVELHGSIEGLSGEDALAIVMASTGWRYHLGNGVLTILQREESDR